MKKKKWLPDYRFKLRARIHEAGFRTLTEYSGRVGTSMNRISRVVSGWDYPSQNLARAMADTLDMTMDEFEKIL